MFLDEPADNVIGLLCRQPGLYVGGADEELIKLKPLQEINNPCDVTKSENVYRAQCKPKTI